MKAFYEFFAQHLEQFVAKNDITDPVAYFQSEMKRQLGRRSDSLEQAIEKCEDIIVKAMNKEHPDSSKIITKRHILLLAFGFHFDSQITDLLLKKARAGRLYTRNAYDLVLLFSLDHGYSYKDFETLFDECAEFASVDDCFYPFFVNDSGFKVFSLHSLEEFTTSCEELEYRDRKHFRDDIEALTERLQSDSEEIETENDLQYLVLKNCGFFRETNERAIRILAEHFQEYLHVNIPFAAECYHRLGGLSVSESKEATSKENSEKLADCDQPLWPVGQVDRLLKNSELCSDAFLTHFSEVIKVLPIEMVETNRQIDRWLGGSTYIKWNTRDYSIRSADTGLQAIFSGQVDIHRSTFLTYIAFFVSRVRVLKHELASGSFRTKYRSLKECERKFYVPRNTDLAIINEELVACGFSELDPDDAEDKLFVSFFRNEKAVSLDLLDLDPKLPFLPLIDFEEDKALARQSKIRLRRNSEQRTK